jgi:hypothetical protein
VGTAPSRLEGMKGGAAPQRVSTEYRPEYGIFWDVFGVVLPQPAMSERASEWRQCLMSAVGAASGGDEMHTPLRAASPTHSLTHSITHSLNP